MAAFTVLKMQRLFFFILGKFRNTKGAKVKGIGTQDSARTSLCHLALAVTILDKEIVCFALQP